METRQIVFRMLVKAKIFLKVFYPNLSGTAVRVQYLSSTPVVLHAENGKKKTEDGDTFSKVAI